MRALMKREWGGNWMRKRGERGAIQGTRYVDGERVGDGLQGQRMRRGSWGGLDTVLG